MTDGVSDGDGIGDTAGALEGIRVVEVAEWLFVPSTGALLADWGADVVHVERLQGDPFRATKTRGVHFASGDVDLMVALTNRGKRSLALDLRTTEGRAVVEQLLESADVFLTSFRPSALAKLGLDPETLLARYPGLVYGRGHGFGIRGAEAEQGGFDATAYWARGGLAHIMSPGSAEYPMGQRPGIGDRSAGMALAYGITTALVKKGRTGMGSLVDVSLLATAMSTLSTDVVAALAGMPPQPPVGRPPMANPLAGIYRTSDGRHIQIAFLQGDRYWAEFCRAVDRPELIDDPRFVDMQARAANGDACIAELDGEFAKRTFVEWKELLGRMDAPWAPVQEVGELLSDPQVEANGYLGPVEASDGHTYQLPRVPVQFDGQPPDLRRAPEHGEHTEEILLQLGYSWDDIGRMKDKGAVL